MPSNRDDAVPDSLPEDLGDPSVKDLMNTLQGFCEESKLLRIEIIGALECVKATMISNWREDSEPNA